MQSSEVLKQILIFKENKDNYSKEEREIIQKQLRKELQKNL